MTAKFLIALFAISCVARTHPWHPPTHELHPRPTTSDIPLGGFHFDPDLIADRVELESKGFEKRISIRFGNQRKQDIGFSASSHDSGNLVAGDIDRDGDVDLIWVGSLPQKTAVVLINQGEGGFAEAANNSPYSSELDELFNIGDPPDRRLVKHRRKSVSLTSPTFSDIAPALASELVITTVMRFPVTAAQRTGNRLACLANDPQRGPPSVLS